MLKYPSDIEKRINSIVKYFGLFNKSTENNPVIKAFDKPGIIIAELVTQYKKGNIKNKEEIISFLSNNLKIKKDKAQKIRKRMEKEIFSQMKEKRKENDKYREQIK